MNLKRSLVAAMLMAMGLLVAVDAGLIDWTTSALADHNEDPNDDNKSPTDDEVDEDEEATASGKKRCNDRPDPKKCRRRKGGKGGKGGKQERRNRDGNRGNRDNRDDTGDPDETDAPPSSPPAPREPECDFDGFTEIETVDDVLCALLEDDDS